MILLLIGYDMETVKFESKVPDLIEGMEVPLGSISEIIGLGGRK